MSWVLGAGVLLLAAATVGAAIGSFLNVVADRLPSGASLLRPASHCPNCARRLTPLELVPILSWLALRGRCRSCGNPIPRRMPLVELGTAVLFVLAALQARSLPLLLLQWLYLSLLMVLAVIDLEHQLIPNVIVFPALVLAGAAAFLQPDRGAVSYFLGGGLAFAALLAIALVRPAGMGMGDVKLAAFVGLILGFPHAVAMLLLAFILGGVVAGGLLLAGAARREDPIAFGPFLSLAGVIGLLYGDRIVALWLGGI